jgi:hypothetical protein
MWGGELDRNVPVTAVERMAAELNLYSLESSPMRVTSAGSQNEERILRALLE